MVGMPGDSRGLRLSVIGIVVFSLFVALFGRLWYLQVVQSDQLAQVASANQVRTVPLRARCGAASSTATAGSSPTTTPR